MKTSTQHSTLRRAKSLRWLPGRRGTMSDFPMVAVTGSQPPYIFDLPHILSLPHGFEFRFRYWVDWVEPELRQKIDNDSGGSLFTNESLVLLFHSKERKLLMPVRQAKVIQLERRGPLYYLRFTVGSFVGVSRAVIESTDREAARTAEQQRLTEWGRQLLGFGAHHDLGLDLPASSFLRFGALTIPSEWDGDVAEVYAEDDRRWSALTSLVMYEPKLRSAPFFFLQGFVDRKGHSPTPKAMENMFAPGKRSGYGFPLVHRQRYRLRLLQWKAKDQELAKPPLAEDPSLEAEGRSKDGTATHTHDVGYRVVCTADERLVWLEGQADRVVGRYDILEYSLRASQRGYGELLLSVEGTTRRSDEEEANTGWPHVYTARVPFQVKRNWVRTGTTLLIALAGGLLLVAPELRFFEGWFTPPLTILSHLAGLGLLFGAYGEFLSGYVGFAQGARGLTPGG
jgi:hypothetical protein